MRNVNRQSLSNLNLRDGVPLGMLALLSRAHGLDLLQPSEYAEEHTEQRPLHQPLGIGESNQGIDFLSDQPTRIVLVVDNVNYPQPGWSFRKQWEDDETCRNMGEGNTCAMPMACVCYG